MVRRRSETVLVTHVADGVPRRRPDELIVEEPMQIQLDGALVATTMRTPGNDFELAVGFCLAEGLVSPDIVTGVRYCAAGPAVASEFNAVSVDTGGRAAPPVARLGTVSSSCGICGSTTIDDLCDRLEPYPPGAWRALSLDLLAAIPQRVSDAQDLFARTGAVHAAATFDAGGSVGIVREDVGRHNAVDKVVGRLALDGALPAQSTGLFVSGRASFEIVQKAWAAGFPAVIAVSAPTSMAVATARRAGMLLAGFARPGRLNLYAPERIDP